MHGNLTHNRSADDDDVGAPVHDQQSLVLEKTLARLVFVCLSLLVATLPNNWRANDDVGAPAHDWWSVVLEKTLTGLMFVYLSFLDGDDDKGMFCLLNERYSPIVFLFFLLYWLLIFPSFPSSFCSFCFFFFSPLLSTLTWEVYI